MKRTIDLDQVRVVQADNYKGNPRVYLEIMDQRVMYSDPATLARNERTAYAVKVTDNGPFNYSYEVDTDLLADGFKARLGRILYRLLMEDDPSLAESWSDDTDRDIDYVKPRFEENRYE